MTVQNSKFKIINSNTGFTLLLAVFIISVVLTISFSVSVFILRELTISNIGRESQKSVFAADSGVECALYWDIKHHSFAITTSDPISQGPNNGNTFVNDASIGSYAWSDTAFAQTSNDSKASRSLQASQSYYLKATGFGFTIPSGATINGIVVEIERSRSSGGGGGIRDNSVKIVKGGIVQGTQKAVADTWPNGADAYKTYGGSSDLWGLSWTADDINASNFGVAISAKEDQDINDYAYVDHIRITVYYTDAAGGGSVISCAGQDYTVGGPSGVSEFTLNFDNGSCAVVNVNKVDYYPLTVIVSRGRSSCVPGAPNRTERTFRVKLK